MSTRFEIITKWGMITLGGITHRTDYPITHLLFHDNHLIILFQDDKGEVIENIWCLNNDGSIKWKGGKIKIEYPIGSCVKRDYMANFIGLDESHIHVVYDIGYELWLEPETGGIVREKFENRRF